MVNDEVKQEPSSNDERDEYELNDEDIAPVSYTHLTLPTSDLV